MHVNIHGIAYLKILCPLLDKQENKSKAMFPYINHLFLFSFFLTKENH